MANSSDTSITKSEASSFIKTSSPGKQLTCKKIKGFYLLRGKNGGTWQFRYTDFSGKRRKLSLGKFVDGSRDRIDAVDSVIEFKSKLNKGDDPALEIKEKKEAFKERSLSQASRTGKAYLNGPYRLHQSRKRNEGKHTIQMIDRAFGELLDKPMDEITKADIYDWQNSYTIGRKDKDTGEPIQRSHETVVRAYGAFKTMVRHAYKNGVISHYTMADINLQDMSDSEKEKLHSKEQTRRRLLTPGEISALNQGLSEYSRQIVEGRESSRKHGKAHLPSLKDLHFPHWFFPFFRLAASTGMRPGDLYNLYWHQLNLNFKRLVKVPNKTRHHKSPAKLDIPLNDDITAIMTKWREQKGQPDDSQLVFPSPVTGKELSNDAHKKHWKNVLSLSGLTSTLDFYSLRHHYISKLVVSGLPLFTVARLAGHKSVKMIEEHYGHLSPHHAAEALANISNDFAEVRKA